MKFILTQTGDRTRGNFSSNCRRISKNQTQAQSSSTFSDFYSAKIGNWIDSLEGHVKTKDDVSK